VSCEVTLITPVALENGLRFAIREGATPSAPARHRDYRVGFSPPRNGGRSKKRELGYARKSLRCSAGLQEPNYTTTKNKKKHTERMEQRVLQYVPQANGAQGSESSSVSRG